MLLAPAGSEDSPEIETERGSPAATGLSAASSCADVASSGDSRWAETPETLCGAAVACSAAFSKHCPGTWVAIRTAETTIHSRNPDNQSPAKEPTHIRHNRAIRRRKRDVLSVHRFQSICWVTWTPSDTTRPRHQPRDFSRCRLQSTTADAGGGDGGGHGCTQSMEIRNFVPI